MLLRTRFPDAAHASATCSYRHSPDADFKRSRRRPPRPPACGAERRDEKQRRVPLPPLNIQTPG
jgi:hypothetical protein